MSISWFRPMAEAPFMTFDQCKAAGLEPYAIYGGKVYSFKEDVTNPATGTEFKGMVVAHGSNRYAEVLKSLTKL